MVEIMTDKATVEIPSPRAGSGREADVRRGADLPGRQGADRDRGRRTRPQATPRRRPAAGARRRRRPRRPAGERAPRNNGVNARDAGVLATPATRKLARDVDVDIREVTGSGPGGRVTSDDVRAHAGSRRAAARAAPAADGDTRIPFRGVRKKIAEHMVLSKHTAAHFTYVEEIDCTELVALRERANARAGGGETRRDKLSFLPFIVKATAAALVKFPQLNATLDDAAGEIVQRAPPPHRPRDRDRRRADRAGRARRGSALDHRARRRDRAAGGAHAHRQGDARGSVRLDVHDHQPGRAGRPAGDADHQSSRGRDPGRPQDRPPPGRQRTTASSSAT